MPTVASTDGACLNLLGYPDLAGAEPEGAAHRAESEQVTGAERDHSAFRIDPVGAWVRGVRCHDRSLTRRAAVRHRPFACSRSDPSRPVFDFGRCRAGQVGPSLVR